MAGELSALIEREFTGPVVWGENDCCMAVANVLIEMTGVDVAEEFRGRYSDRAGAYELMGRGGVMATAERRTAELGWPEVDEPRDGDVGVAGRSLAIFCGCWVAKGEIGMVPLARVTKAWRPK